MFGTFADPKAVNEQPVEAQISKVAADIEEQEDYANSILEKAREPLYIAASPMATAYIGRKEVQALVDTGAEVTVMTVKLANSLRLLMIPNFRVNMSSAMGKSKRFVGLCEDVPISIGKITYRVPVWVIDKLEHRLILGRTYHKLSGLAIRENDDGTCSATIYTPDRTGVITWQAVGPDSDRNQSREDLLNHQALNSRAET